jgi:hypothetical protein
MRTLEISPESDRERNRKKGDRKNLFGEHKYRKMREKEERRKETDEKG